MPAARMCVAVICLTLNACASTPQREPERIPQPLFRLDRPDALPRAMTISLAESRGYLFTPVHINRQPAGMFMLDTGAGTTVVETGVAGRLGLPEVGQGKAMGVGGTEAFAWRGVESVSFGDLVSLPGERVAALSLHEIARGLGVPVAGIVGYGSFGSTPFTIDYPARRLILHRRDAFRPPVGAPALRLIRYGRIPMVEATVGDPADRRKVRLIIDTGAHNQLTLPSSMRAAWPAIQSVPHHGRVRTSGVGGTVTGAGTWVNRLDVLGVTLRDVPTNFEPTPEGQAPSPVPVGRIGNALLRDFVLSFDPASRRVWAVYQPTGENERKP